MPCPVVDGGRFVPTGRAADGPLTAEMVAATVNKFPVQAALKEARGIIERERIVQLTQCDAARQSHANLTVSMRI